MNKITLTLHESFTNELKPKWHKLESEYGWSPFQNFSWLSTWYNEIGKNLNVVPKIVVIQNEQDVVAILPFSVRKYCKIEILEWLGGIHSDYKGPIINKQYTYLFQNFENTWNAICNIIGKFDVLYFNRQPRLINGEINPFYLQFECLKDIKSYKTKLDSPWESFFESKIKKKQIADSKRQLKRLNSLGNLHFLVAKEDVTSRNIIEKMIEFKRERYKETNSYDYLKIEFHRNFFHKLTEIHEPTISIHISAFILNNEIISTHVGIIWSNKFYYLMPSNENKVYRSFSTGRLLLEELIKNSLINGIDYFDFTIGSEEYKKSWCDIEEQLYEIILPFTVFGFFYKKTLMAKKYIYNNKLTRLIIKAILKIIRL